ncbi:MAG: hypothetical protein P8046_08035 [Anaerolineales bacterium]
MDNKLLIPPRPNSPQGLVALRALIGERSVLAALTVLHRQMGDIFQIPLPGFDPVVMIGPEANRFVLVGERDKLLWRNEADPVVDLLHHGVLVIDGVSAFDPGSIHQACQSQTPNTRADHPRLLLDFFAGGSLQTSRHPIFSGVVGGLA